MNIEYTELETPEHFKECVSLQKTIFHLSDIDVIPEMFLMMIARKDPMMGILVGAFKSTENSKQLIGFHISIATCEKNSMYGVATGILPEYQNKMYGYSIILKAREIGIRYGVKTLFTLYDPLESNLARLYMQKFGFKGVRFKENAYELNNKLVSGNEIPNDKILVKWDVNCNETLSKIKGQYKQVSLSEALNKYPVISQNKFVADSTVLFEIPNDFVQMKKNNFDKALAIRMTVRKFFSEYINKRNYIIADCLTSRIETKRKTYYLLEKQ